jgi:hypothetical protein
MKRIVRFLSFVDVVRAGLVPALMITTIHPRRNRQRRRNVLFRHLHAQRCKHAYHMSKRIQIRNVRDGIHRTLKVRAAKAGLSLSDYVLKNFAS